MPHAAIEKVRIFSPALKEVIMPDALSNRFDAPQISGLVSAIF